MHYTYYNKDITFLLYLSINSYSVYTMEAGAESVCLLRSPISSPLSPLLSQVTYP